MASIIKRKKNYSIVYNYVDENGETKQKWETRHFLPGGIEAQGGDRKSEQLTGTPFSRPPIRLLRSSFLTSFLFTAKSGGACPCTTAKTSLIANYINPIIGDMKVQDGHARGWWTSYIQTLQKTPVGDLPRPEQAVTDLCQRQRTIEKIIKLLRCAFKQAVRWELIAKKSL